VKATAVHPRFFHPIPRDNRLEFLLYYDYVTFLLRVRYIKLGGMQPVFLLIRKLRSDAHQQRNKRAIFHADMGMTVVQAMSEIEGANYLFTTTCG
jgi:hypothetical protein